MPGTALADQHKVPTERRHTQAATPYVKANTDYSENKRKLMEMLILPHLGNKTMICITCCYVHFVHEQPL